MRLHHSFAAFSLAVTISFSASADVITDWNIIAIDAARVFANPNPSTRAIAIGHLAAYDAVNAITHSGEKYLPGELAVTLPASANAAAIQAFHDALVFAVPAKQSDLDKALKNALADLADGAAKTNGIAVGKAAAAALVAARTNDGAETPQPYLGEDALGKWRPTPAGNLAANTPEWATLKPFALTSPTQFDPGPPPALSSGRYATDLLETKLYGAKTGSTRTAEQTTIAQFWAQQTQLPVFQLARTFSKSHTLTLDENARFFGQLSLALADARIAVWSAKYEYGLWRPVTSINSPLDDGNPDTTPDPEGDWLPLLETPNHPEYVSGHSATGAAGAAVLAAWFGDENSFAVTSETLVGAAYTRSFTRFSDAAQENANSRIYGGIHYRFSNEAGLALGKKVAGYVLTHTLAAFPDTGEGGAGGADAGGSGAGGETDSLGGAPTTAGTGGTSAGTAGTVGSAGGANVAGNAGTTSQPSGEAGEPTTAEGGAPSTGGSANGAGNGGKSTGKSDESDDSGCSVSAPSGSSKASSLLVLLGLAGALARRRRR
jgi:MYXO-CTERM domain-containing protein